MTKTKLKAAKREGRKLTLAVTATENDPPAMYLREVVGEGTCGERPIEIAWSGASVIVMIGKFPEGRQFVVPVAAIGQACCNLPAPVAPSPGSTP